MPSPSRFAPSASPWRRAAAAAALAAVAALPAHADDAGLTLAQALQRALANGAAARIARLETERASESAGEARGAYLPQLWVTSEAGWSNQYNENFKALGPNGKTVKLGLATLGTDRGWINVYISQILFDLGRWRRIEREKLAAEAASIGEQHDRDEVAFEVMRRFALLARLEDEDALLRQHAAAADWLDQQAQVLLKAGRALEVDRSLASLNREDVELAQRDLADQREGARRSLWLALGGGDEPPASFSIAAGSLPEPTAPVEPERLADALAGAPDLRVLALRQRMQDLEVGAEKARRLPTVNLVAGYANYGPKRFDNYTDEVTLGVNFEFHVFDGFQTSHAIGRAERDAAIARIRYESTLKDKRARAQDLLRQLDTAGRRAELAKRRADAAREQERLADLALRAGRGGLEQALDARARVDQIDREALEGRFHQLELWARLQRELGRLARSLGAPAPASSSP